MEIVRKWSSRTNALLGVVALALLISGTVVLAAPGRAHAKEGESMATAADVGTKDVGLALLAAAVSVGLSCLAAGVAVAGVGAAAMGAVAERPELMGRSLIFVGLAEGIAIYGLIVAIIILGKV